MWARVMRQGLEAVRQEPDQRPGATGSFGDSRLLHRPQKFRGWNREQGYSGSLDYMDR